MPSFLLPRFFELFLAHLLTNACLLYTANKHPPLVLLVDGSKNLILKHSLQLFLSLLLIDFVSLAFFSFCSLLSSVLSQAFLDAHFNVFLLKKIISKISYLVLSTNMIHTEYFISNYWIITRIIFIRFLLMHSFSYDWITLGSASPRTESLFWRSSVSCLEELWGFLTDSLL